MNWIDIKWKTMTPLLMHSVSNRIAEIRATPFKMAMRYWFRALHGNYDLEKLQEKESEIFGSSDEKYGKSKFQIRIMPKIEPPNTMPKGIPVKMRGNRPISIQGFEPGVSFTTRIQTLKDEVFLIDKAKLHVISALLGGFGQRSRRGYGALQIENVMASDGLRGQPLIEQLNNIKEYNIIQYLEFLEEIICDVSDLNYELDTDYYEIIWLNEEDRGNDKIPYLKSMTIGRSFDKWDEFTNLISKMCHDKLQQYSQEGKRNEYHYMGYAFPRNKQSSTLYISAVEIKNKIRPILSELCPVFKQNDRNVPNRDQTIIDEFFEDLAIPIEDD
ncbi:MAG: type III-B CRISPR module RAMP protein Cmr1 [Candidatus Lokiarchaeota archaeon]|nr:type III-B CRISPR module RAMP protein Cmr1 [Candidatus Lokiarchaeota archaeon]